jgi:uncharacterized protein (TIGR02099 family)
MMIEPTSHPSFLLKAGAVTARWALGVVALAWIVLFIVWGGLHFLIVPRIADLRPWLETHATKAVGATVRIGSIAARSEGVIPTFELKDVTVLDAQEREVLRLPTVVVALSLRSALGMELAQLYIEGPVLEVRRAQNGRLWLAGVELPDTDPGSSAAMDWIFSQTELVVVQGTLHWMDELRAAPPLTLRSVDLVLRNRLRTHSMRLDATPPSAWGERISVSAVFKQPLLSRHAGDWKAWSGQLYADVPQLDLAQLGPYADVGVDLVHGAGMLRAWADVDRAALTSATVDMALRDVDVRVDPKLDALTFRTVAGRLGGRKLRGGFEVSTQSLEFVTQDGLRWPGGNMRFAHYAASQGVPERGELVADRLDLEALAQIAGRLPVGEAAHTALTRFAPRGLVSQLKGSWTGPMDRPTFYAAKGQVKGLALADGTHHGEQTPGFQGLDIDFELDSSAGKARVAMQSGFIDAVGIFDEPRIPIGQLNGALQWKWQGDELGVTVSGLRFSNADAQGELHGSWKLGGPAFPGVVELNGNLARASGNRVYRYLPKVLNAPVREYLHDSIVSGNAVGVKFKVKGDLNDFPYADPKKGEFRVSADLQNVVYAYAPARILPKDSLPWPALNQVSGELLIERGSLRIKAAHVGLVGVPGLQISKVDALISDLYGDASLALTAEARGPLADGLAIVNSTPLSGMTDHVLARAALTGMADFRVKLGFPLASVERASVQGAVVLAGNDVQISPETPRLTRARGVVSFSESGFLIVNGQARALGGDVRIEGGLNTRAPNTLRIQGTVTAEGLRQAQELGLAARLGEFASGATTYTISFGARAGVQDMQITSNLVGMALNLPTPLAKPAASPLPLRFGMVTLAGHDQVQLELGKLASITYERELAGTQARVLRGAIGIGLADDESAPLPTTGVVANIRMDRVDLDAWLPVLSRLSGKDLATEHAAAPPVPAAGDPLGYLPTSMVVRARELAFDGRTLNRLVLGFTRDGLLWRGNLDATEMNGYVEYGQPSGAYAGRLYARLARLSIGPSAAQDVESLLDEQPASIPALDVVVDDFELRGKHLGRVEVFAVNTAAGPDGARESGREWRLNRFNISTPEAVLTATGSWAPSSTASTSAGPRSIKDRRRTVMDFKLDIVDAGAFLERFGMSGVVRRGEGRIDGQVAWQGSPITLDYPSLGGSIKVNVEGGQFLKADPGIAKLLGVLSLQSLPRRLALDFRDVFSQGFAFDFLRGDVAIAQGIARTSNLQMKGVSATVLMDGQADIAKETQAIRVLIVPEINAGSASLLASALNPVVGLTTFLAQVILRRPLIDAATQELFVDGTWVDPRVTPVPRSKPP